MHMPATVSEVVLAWHGPRFHATKLSRNRRVRNIRCCFDGVLVVFGMSWKAFAQDVHD